MPRSISLSIMRAQAWASDLVSKFFSGLDSPYGESALPTVLYEHRAATADCRHSNHYRYCGAEQTHGKTDFQD
ncbi:hypothetical protein ALQ34_200018 [Pseudomonas syringae pv. maculicola]|uniref:Uncharacterized protein n=1 Tax=Pseudomonas syringae pv. maculicola TaxID=59511 RepID=A0A3M6BZC3_PSEYM|nr:hypothetical protein ALQ34_200018 [Pseudomonas syringae pv. maculicola]RMV36883.1 hypothetical protein ALP13_200139 [Pseudomonas syringae pv. maculicola]